MAKKRKKKAHGAATAPSRSPSTAKPAAERSHGAGNSGRHALDPILLGLAGMGVALTLYLTGVAWIGDHPVYCSAGSSCDLVQSSRWSTLLGVPMSLWGLLTYLVLARFLWRLRTHATAWRPALLIALVGAGISWYLTLVSVMEIEATCVYCLASFAIMNLLLVLLLLRRPGHVPENAWGQALPLPLGACALILIGLHLHFSGLFDPAAGPEDPYLKALAIHLDDSGAKFYGAYWCPHCQDQKALFEASVDRLPYVECTPSGRSGPVNLACINAGIKDYPTWVIGDARHGSVLTPKRLAVMSGFKAGTGARSP